MSGYTDAYIEREIISEVIRNGGFSTFWIEENPRRAAMATAMFADGRLISEGGQYPFTNVRLGNKELTP